MDFGERKEGKGVRVMERDSKVIEEDNFNGFSSFALTRKAGSGSG